MHLITRSFFSLVFAILVVFSLILLSSQFERVNAAGNCPFNYIETDTNECRRYEYIERKIGTGFVLHDVGNMNGNAYFAGTEKVESAFDERVFTVYKYNPVQNSMTKVYESGATTVFGTLVFKEDHVNDRLYLNFQKDLAEGDKLRIIEIKSDDTSEILLSTFEDYYFEGRGDYIYGFGNNDDIYLKDFINESTNLVELNPNTGTKVNLDFLPNSILQNDYVDTFNTRVQGDYAYSIVKAGTDSQSATLYLTKYNLGASTEVKTVQINDQSYFDRIEIANNKIYLTTTSRITLELQVYDLDLNFLRVKTLPYDLNDLEMNSLRSVNQFDETLFQDSDDITINNSNIVVINYMHISASGLNNKVYVPNLINPIMTFVGRDVIAGSLRHSEDREECKVFSDGDSVCSSMVYHDYQDTTVPVSELAGYATLFRYYNDDSKSHFYTSYDKEHFIVGRNDFSWDFEGFPYLVSNYYNESASCAVTGSVPVYRFYSENYKSHFFTKDKGERDKVISEDPNWNYEGIGYCVFENDNNGRIPVYRFYSENYRSHFFTESAMERDFIIDNDYNWNYEGIAYYVRK